MLIIRPLVHETLWGGERLTAYSGTQCRRIGHLYSLISNGEFESEIAAGGPWRGRLFRDYFEHSRERLGLGSVPRLPFLIALVDASADLSLQVHPDDSVAGELDPHLTQGKNESWYFLESPSQGWIYNGCQVTERESCARLLRAGRYRDLMRCLKVRAGDYVFVAAGTMHALTAGSLVYEIEENSPATYRIYDFERVDCNGHARQLHTAAALRALHPELISQVRHYAGGCEISERQYATRLLEGGRHCNASSSLECLTCLNGQLQLEDYAVQRGVTVVLEPGEVLQCGSCLFMAARPIVPEGV